MTTTLSRPPAAAPGPDAAPRSPATGGVLAPSVAAGAAVMLAAVSISPLVQTLAWFGTTLVVVAVVVAVGGLASWVRIPVFLVPILQAAALFTTLVWQFASDPPLGFFPSPDALGDVRLVLADGMSSVDQYAPPIPDQPGVDAVVALGLGCVTIVVFVLAVSLRMPVLAGLGIVAVYVVPSFVLDDGSPWWTFVAVAAGVMVLLVSDERVGLVSWGRVLRRGGASVPRSSWGGLSSAAVRLGSIAILAALVLPVLIPSLADAVLARTDNGGGDGTGTGTGTRAAQVGISPFASLRRDLLNPSDTVVLRYTTSSAAPPYLRTVVLESYIDEQWRVRDFPTGSAQQVSDTSTITPTLGGTVAGSSQRYTIVADAFVDHYLPVPEGVTAIRGIGGQWYVDPTTGTVFSKDSDTRGQSWQADALSVEPTVSELEAAQDTSAPAEDSARLSAGIPSAVADLASSVTAGAKTDFEKALALQSFFLTNFTYSTDVTSDQSASYLEQFLTDRKGYCQQFAATMALMAKSLGIDSRVVIGYTGGTLDSDGTTWIVRSKDAHAWPELSFPGVGWVRFEPTPRAASDGGAVAAPAYATKDVAEHLGEVVKSATAISANNNLRKLQQFANRNERLTAGGVPTAATTADQWRVRALLLLAVLGLTAAAVPATWRWVRRRRRLSGSGDVEDAWDELRDTARDLGVPWSEASTPRQAVASVIERQRLRGEVAEAATRIGRTTERARYAPTPPDAAGLVDDVSTVRTALLERVDRSTRLRATLLPASLRRFPR